MKKKIGKKKQEKCTYVRMNGEKISKISRRRRGWEREREGEKGRVSKIEREEGRREETEEIGERRRWTGKLVERRIIEIGMKKKRD